MQAGTTKWITITSCLFLAGTGLVALFIPEELSTFLSSPPENTLLPQLYGAGLLGLAYSNWHVRRAPLGGIYGRAVVTGSLIHYLSGSAILLGTVFDGNSHYGILTQFCLYAIFAIGFSAILWKGNSRQN